MFGLDPITELALDFMLIGFISGYFAYWMKTPEGEWTIQWRLFKKPAKIVMTYIPGRTFKQEVVVPKTEDWQKKPQGFIDKLLGRKASDETFLPGWFRPEAPVYRRVGSAAQYILLRQGEAPALDLDKMEYGYYEPQSAEDKEAYAKSQTLIAKNQELSEQYKAAAAGGNLEAAKVIQQQAEQNEAEYRRLIYSIQEHTAWHRITVLPTHVVTVLINNALSLVKAKEYQGFLGKLDKLLKDIKWQQLATMIFAGVAAMAGIYLFFKLGGIQFGGMGG